jgi:hypothetical protein
MHLEMRSTLDTMKAGIATALSMCIAVLACVMGCMLPALANSHVAAASSTQKNSANHSHSGLMADKENCHHSDSNSTAPPGDREPASNGAVSCCPLEITVTQKWDVAKLRIAPAPDFALSSDFHIEIPRSSSPAEFAPSISHGGRDTLLESHLLRI